MKFLSLQPFVPSGSNFESSKQFFVELGFKINWDAGDYTGFERDGCKFILQKFDNKDFAENFMITVGVDNVDEFRKEVLEKKLPEKFGIRIGEVSDMPYGREVNIIDIATNKVLCPVIVVGASPADIAISPDGERAYVSDYSDNTVSVIDIVDRMWLKTCN